MDKALEVAKIIIASVADLIFQRNTVNSFESMRQIANSGLNPIKFGEHYEVDYAPSFEVNGILQDADYYAELIEKLCADNFDLKSK